MGRGFRISGLGGLGFRVTLEVQLCGYVKLYSRGSRVFTNLPGQNVSKYRDEDRARKK